MRDDEIGLYFSDEVSNRVGLLIRSDLTNFVELLSLLDLDPAKDLRCSNLRSVDFSNCDLCGFDFSGSDLRGAFGQNVRYDSTTIFTGADTDSSIFSYACWKRTRSPNSVVDAHINRLSKDYWLNQTISIDSIIANEKDKSKTLLYLTSMFEQTSHLSVRHDMLLRIGLYARSTTDYVSFLSHLCASRTEVATIASAIRVLADIYHNREDAVATLRLFSQSEDNTIRSAALEGLIRSKFIVDNYRIILQQMQRPTLGKLRRLLVGRISGLLGPTVRSSCIDSIYNRYLDYNDTIDDRYVQNLTYAYLKSVRLPSSIELVLDRMRDVIKSLLDMQEYGIPFRIEISNAIMKSCFPK